LAEGGESRVDLGFGPSSQDRKLDSLHARRFLHGSDVGLGHFIVRVHQQGDYRGPANQLAKQLEPLGRQLDGEVAEAGEVAPRPGETGDQASSFRKPSQTPGQPGDTIKQAYTFDGRQWKPAPEYLPPVPFVTQYNAASDQSIDLFVQLIGVDGSGLPSLVASYTDPITNNVTNKVWLNSGNGWDGNNSIQVPHALDAIYREPKTLIQIVDVNGDGLPDIVMTKGDCPGQNPGDCSKTWLGTGRGWVESPNWRVPSEAVTAKDGDPGFRLVDTKGDGYLDVLWMRRKADGTTPDKGLFLNDGHGWSTKAPEDVVPDLPFADNNGIDQGVRLLSVTGKGLTDIVKSMAGSQQIVQLNRSRRSDILRSVVDGYGLRTNIFYETLLEIDGADPDSGVEGNGPLGWRPYERGTSDTYPKLAPVPTTYVVRKAAVDEGNGRPVSVYYRYGNYRVDGVATRSLGFGWRESLNDFSNILTRSEAVQDARARPGISREATCVVRQDTLKAWAQRDQTTGSIADRFPENLCPPGDQAAFPWGYKITDNSTCWTIFEGDLVGQVNDIQLPASDACGPDVRRGSLTGVVIRQSAISKSRSLKYEVDGGIISGGTNTFTYDTDGGVLSRSGNVLSTLSSLDDGTSIETKNDYSDNHDRWFLGRLTKTVVTKRGDLVNGVGPARKTETQCTRFEYDGLSGLLALQEVNCGSPKSVTTQVKRDDRGNVVQKTIIAAAEPAQVTSSEFDGLGRFEVATTNVLGHRSTVLKDPATGQTIVATDSNGLTTTFGYDAFGRLRVQTSPTGIQTRSDLIGVGPGTLPLFYGTQGISAGLPVAVKYAIKTQVGSLPATWRLLDVKGRQLREVTNGFAPASSTPRYIFKDATYDLLGRVVSSSVPYDARDSPRWSINEYDDLGRVCASIAINGLRTETIFSGLPAGGARVVIAVDPRQQLTGHPPMELRRLSSHVDGFSRLKPIGKAAWTSARPLPSICAN
jgi:YD repeat-containing protein